MLKINGKMFCGPCDKLSNGNATILPSTATPTQMCGLVGSMAMYGLKRRKSLLVSLALRCREPSLPQSIPPLWVIVSAGGPCSSEARLQEPSLTTMKPNVEGPNLTAGGVWFSLLEEYVHASRGVMRQRNLCLPVVDVCVLMSF